MRRCARVRTATSPRVILSLLAAVLIAAYGATAHAQSSDRVGMSFKAPEGEFTVGEVVPLTLEATYPTGFQVILPVLPRSWGAFEVRSQSPAVVEDRDDGSSSISQTIEIVLFAPGEHSTPELLVTVRDPSGKMTDIAAPMATVQVVSVLGEDDLDLRDIRPQEALSLPPLWPWFAVPLVLIAAVAAGAYYIVARRREAVSEAAPFVDPRSPYEKARDELDEIESMGVLSQGRVMAHYVRVSDCIREYLDAGFGLPAIDLTTGEIRRELRRISMALEPSRWTVGLLEDCDLVKFAKYAPGAAEADGVIDRARRILEATRPLPEAEEQGGADVGGQAALVDAS
jgi:hypothetical protein